MSRIMLMGDIHLRDRAPRSCHEPYLDDLVEILLHAAELSWELRVDATVFAGDIFDHPQPARTSHRTVLKAINAFQQFKNPWIVVGNHDTTHHRLDSVREQQPLGVLLESGVVKELDGWHPELPIFGVPWQQHWHLEETPAEAFSSWRAQGAAGRRELKSSLAITHAPIYPPATRDEQVFELVAGEALADAMDNQGCLYYGHIHEDHGFWYEAGVQFGNVGAISRGSLTEYNRDRDIQAAIWEEDSGFRALKLPAKPADEVFKVAEVAELKQQKLDLNEFLSSVGSTTLQISSTSSVVDHLRQLELEDDVKKTAIELVELAG